MEHLPSTPGILPLRMGGLGNQLFIVAAGFVASKATGLPLYLPILHKGKNKHNTKHLNYNETVFRCMGIQLSAEEPSIQAEAQKQGYKPHTYNRVSGFSAWNPETIQPRTMLDTYYQFYPALQPYERQLRAAILEGLDCIRTELQAQYNTQNAAFLHVRRGDYLDIPHVHYAQPLNYYETAMAHLSNSVQTLYIFSDDIEWCRKQTVFQTPKSVFVPETLNEIESLALMSLCTEGAICANSTFSWWGAFLGAYAKHSPVIVPSRWICDPIVSLFPEEWIVL